MATGLTGPTGPISLPSTNNSLSQFLTQLLRIQKNSMAIIGSLNAITTSNAPTILIPQTDATGAIQSYEVPSIGYIKSQISRIDSNFNLLSGLDGGDVTVRLPDGTFRTLIQSSLFREPQVISQLQVPSTFNQRNNWFFQNFLDPLLYVSFDITKYVDYNTRQVSYKRMILNCDTNAKIQYFNSSIKGINTIDYNTLITNLVTQQISYFVDEGVTDLPASLSRYQGLFDVIAFKDIDTPITQPNGTILTVKVRNYQLNTLKYTDNLQNYQNTLILKPGDSLDYGVATTYTVNTVDTSTNMVTLTMTVGTETIPIGVGVLNISSEAFALKEVQLNIGYNERQVIFIKAIDSSSNLTNRDFSPGVAFYSNDLNITTSTGTFTLAEYYSQNVMDFGAPLVGMVKDAIVPAIYGIKPQPPTLSASNFNVVLTNPQLFNTVTINQLKTKISQKNTIAAEISKLNDSINTVKQNLNTSKFTSEAQRRGVQNQLDSLIQQKTAESNLYASIIQDLSTTAKNLPPELSNEAFSVRGFFPFPSPISATNTNNQEVIGFIVAYRYLQKDGTAPGSTQMNYIDNTGQTVVAYYSNWYEMHTKIRTKSYNSSLGIYTWNQEDVQNSDSVNVNQIDIPIQSGEQVEIRIKSISEAGWPINPIISDWSSSVIVQFPDSLNSDEEILASLSSALAEQSRVNFNNDLSSMGLDLHLSTAFISQDNYYAHASDNISSGFFDSAGNIINLYDFINTLQNQIQTLQGIINKAVGVLEVSIIDSLGNQTSVSNISTVNLFGGYYSDLVNSLPSANQKGAIITQIYKIVLSNSTATPLQLVSNFPGGINVGLPNSLQILANGNGDMDYARSRNYDLVPISLSSLDSASTTNGSAYQASPFQSAQQLSQYIYSRYTDIGLKNPLYSINGGSLGASGPVNNSTYSINNYGPTGSSLGSSDFIWNFNGTAVGSSVLGYNSDGTPIGGGNDSPFAIHISHPLINDGSSTSLSELNPRYTDLSLTGASILPEFSHSYLFNLQASDNLGTLQTQYLKVVDPSSSSVISSPIKMGFYANDRYLIGTNTCGAYLYLAPSTYSDLLVNGTDYRATRTLVTGTANQIIIPVIFQFRMTDFFGSGTLAPGRIGGFLSQPKNLIYTKKIGIDISSADNTTFSFDLQISAKYKIDSPSQTSISPVNNNSLSSTQNQSINNIF